MYFQWYFLWYFHLIFSLILYCYILLRFFQLFYTYILSVYFTDFHCNYFIDSFHWYFFTAINYWSFHWYFFTNMFHWYISLIFSLVHFTDIFTGIYFTDIFTGIFHWYFHWYISLQIKEVKGTLDAHIHFWLGKETSQDEAGVAAFKVNKHSFRTMPSLKKMCYLNLCCVCWILNEF